MRMILPVVVAALLPACSFLFGDSASGDLDASPSSNDGGINSISFDVAGTYWLNTSTSSLALPDGEEVELVSSATSDAPPTFVVHFDNLDLPSDGLLRVVGARPAEIHVHDRLTLVGTIDVSSYRGDPELGAGAGPMTCSTQMHADQRDLASNTNSGGGGGGGSMPKNGSEGGTADGGSAEGAPAGTLDVWSGVLRGGCTGGNGAMKEEADGMSARGGQGGGGLHLIVDGALVVQGSILAGGAAGAGGEQVQRGGGGGGGSGGVIWLEAADIVVDVMGRVSAQGAGGGAGSDQCGSGTSGDDGAGHVAEAAPGGAANECALGAGGAGGAGAFGINGNPGDAGNGSLLAGGGGGGGSPGYVLWTAPAFAASPNRVSPPPLEELTLNAE